MVMAVAVEADLPWASQEIYGKQLYCLKLIFCTGNCKVRGVNSLKQMKATVSVTEKKL
jgi:hypothetical protein